MGQAGSGGVLILVQGVQQVGVGLMQLLGGGDGLQPDGIVGIAGLNQGQVQGRYMSTATRITQDNQEIQKLQQQDYQRIADYLHESEKSSAKFWVACNQTMQKYVEAAAQGMEKVSAANQAGKDVLEANRKLVEQLDVKMKDFVSYQKMTYETMEEVRRLFADISVQKEDNNIYLSGGKSAQSAAQKESVEEVRKLLEEQSERQEALLEEMNKNMKNISKNQKGKFSLFK